MKKRQVLPFKSLDSDIAQVEAGTIDKFNMKSVFLSVSFNIKNYEGDFNKKFRGWLMNLKYLINDYIKTSSVFYDRYIFIDDKPDEISESGNTFINLEMNFFNKNKDKSELVTELTGILSIIEGYLKSTDVFDIQKFSDWKQKRLNLKMDEY